MLRIRSRGAYPKAHTQTHTHAGLCARDRVTCSAPNTLARGLPKRSHTLALTRTLAFVAG